MYSQLQAQKIRVSQIVSNFSIIGCLDQQRGNWEIYNFPPSSGTEEGSDSGSISLWKQKNAASSWILTTSAAVKLFWVLVQLCYRESGKQWSVASEILLSLVAS